MKPIEYNPEQLNSNHLIWSELTETQKTFFARYKPNNVTICQKYNRNAQRGPHYHITVSTIDSLGFIIASFDTMLQFKQWMKAIDVKLAKLVLTNNTPGNRVYQGQLDCIVYKNILYWHTKDLPFNQLVYIGKESEILDHHCICQFHQNYRYPVKENGRIVWGYIQATENARIVWAPNSNSQLYQPLPNSYHWGLLNY